MWIYFFSAEPQPIRFFITLLFTVLNSTATENASQSSEYFSLLSRLLASASASGVAMNAAGRVTTNAVFFSVSFFRSRTEMTSKQGHGLMVALLVSRKAYTIKLS